MVLAVGDECFDNECSADREPLGDGVKTPLLRSVLEQVEKGVVCDEGRIERTVWQIVNHVASDCCDAARWVAERELGEHGGTCVDAGDAQTPLRP